MDKKIQYEALEKVLESCYEDAAFGKGASRHETNVPFEQQISCTITRDLGIGYPIGQARKKIDEAMRIRKGEAKLREMRGAIVFLAIALIIMEENYQAYKRGATNGKTRSDVSETNDGASEEPDAQVDLFPAEA